MLKIILADFTDRRVGDLLHTHVVSARAQTALGSAHALDLTALQSPNINVWAIWEGEALVAIGALRQIEIGHGEVKSMHVAQSMRGRGVGSVMIRHIVSEARNMGLSRISLETGSWEYFRPAQRLYKRHGFIECPPFADYVADPNSVFMSLDL
jgi:putative acetyltransferase